MRVINERTDPEPAERKPVPGRERMRKVLALRQRIQTLKGKTDIHSHIERAKLEQEMDALLAL